MGSVSKVRRLGMAAAVSSAASGLAVFAGSGVAAAELPSQCVQSQKTVTCTYADSTGAVSPSGGIHGVPLRIPDGVRKVHIEAVGGRGGDSCCSTVASGGRGAVAGGDAWLVPGSTVYVRVGENGHGGGSDALTQVEGGGGSGGTTDWRRNTTPPNINGGDGGGLSAVVLDTGRSSVLVPHRIELPLVIAAGGGGGASTASGMVSPGGDAGAPGGGARGGATPSGYGSFAQGGGQGVFGSDGSSPAGLAGGPGYGGSAGSSGATLPAAVGDGIGAGGGGGAGWYGGGGGAAGGRIGGTGEANEPPGGGGGGLSLVPSGGTIGLSSTDSVPSVVVTFDLP
ncbi:MULTISPECIES: hypothetical protein [Rhodococcus]|uniref:hypothetical protein n=1 Tax=Rhodococcus TaxID=1827 RepID=UPI00042E7E7B|nr:MULTISPECIES: hypothetical protein [Rhodococcus]AHK29023.1 hypothetical protein Pd630_LPD01794 [Rhodococcus opacus PD630]UDG98853.1 hypothetical protein K2Z90_001716 [Rhodococcus opacus PD630]